MEVLLCPRTLKTEIGDLLPNRSLNKSAQPSWQSFLPNSAERWMSAIYCSDLKQNQTAFSIGMLLGVPLTNFPTCCFSLHRIGKIRAVQDDLQGFRTNSPLRLFVKSEQS